VASRTSARRGLYADSYLDSMSPEPQAKEVRDFLERPPDGWRMWVAEEGGRVVAFAKAGPSAYGGSGSVAELDAMYVEPSRFRRGIGTRLLGFVQAELAAAGFDRAVLWVLAEDRAAQAFYAANGWSPGDQSKELLKDRPRVVQLWHKVLA
jgi:GNAT superfamily N-acetyltransferase